MMIDKIKSYIFDNSLLSENDKVILSLSGGPDSVALFHIFLKLNIQFCAFHLNHMLRGQAADMDETFCRGLCKKNKIEIIVHRENIRKIAKEKKISVEAAGRERRYKLLEDICQEKDIDKIATAHNMDDNAESIMLNIIRGTGLHGLCGIQSRRDNIIRPLLGVKKSEIISYLEENSLEFRIDETNNESDYFRNYIRHEIISKIEKKFDTDLTRSIARMSKTLSEDDSFIDNIAKTVLEKDVEIFLDNAIVNRFVLTRYPLSIKKRVIFKMIEMIKGDIKDIEQVHIDNIIDLLQKQSGSQINLPNKIVAAIEFDKLHIKVDSKVNKKKVITRSGFKLDEWIQVDETEFYFEEMRMCSIVSGLPKKDSGKIYLDYDKIRNDKLEIRYRNEFDYISPLGRKVTKKLKKYFIEIKVPKEKRNSIPMLVRGNEVVWIPGYDYSDKCVPGSETKIVLVCEYR